MPIQVYPESLFFFFSGAYDSGSSMKTEKPSCKWTTYKHPTVSVLLHSWQVSKHSVEGPPAAWRSHHSMPGGQVREESKKKTVICSCLVEQKDEWSSHKYQIKIHYCNIHKQMITLENG